MLLKSTVAVYSLSFCAIRVNAQVQPIASHLKPAVLSHSLREINALRQQGQKAIKQKHFSLAQQRLLAALAKARAISDKYVMSSLLNDLGNLAHDTGRHKQARDHHTEALALYQQCKEADHKKRVIYLALLQGELGTDWHELASVSNDTKQYEMALRYLTQGVYLFESQNDYRFVRGLLQRLDDVQQHLGRYDQALIYYHHALRLRQKMGFEDDIATSLENLGNAYWILTRHNEALRFYADALMLWKKRSDNVHIGSCLNGIGKAHLGLFQFQDAKASFTQALTRLQASETIKRALSYMGLGGACIGLNQYEEARNDYTQALALYQRANDKEGIAGCQQSLWLIREIILSPNAHVPSPSPLSNTKQIPSDEMNAALSLLTQGSTDFLQGKMSSAAVSLLRAQSLFVKIHAPQHLAACSNLLAEIYARQGLLDKSATEYRTAITRYEEFSEQVGDPGRIGQLQDMGAYLYARYARLLLRQGHKEQALLAVERGRCQGLARQATQNRVEYSPAILSKSEVVELRSRSDALNGAARDYFDRHITQAQARYEEAKLRRDLLNTTLYKRHPQYKRLRGAEQQTFAPLQTLAQRHPDTLYLQWAMVDDKTTLLFALSHAHGLQTFVLPYGGKMLSGRVHAWRTALTAPGRLADRRTPHSEHQALLLAQTREPRLAAELYATLFADVEKAGLLRNTKRLVIAADDPLLDLPFAALNDVRGHRLTERYALSSTISLGTLLWPSSPRRPDKSLLCVADPFGDTQPALPVTTAGGRYDPLPGARKFGKEITASVPGAAFYPGLKAKKSVVLPTLSHYAVLLFATHGLLDASNGLRSALVLAPASLSSPKADLLPASEIAGQQLSAWLAVLAACESGLGQEGGGEGLVGLAWAFRAAGCPCVMASQWKVDDAATGNLMTQFFRNLKAHKPKDEALREAMRRVRQEPGHAAPYYWAAFQMIGDTGSVRIPGLTGSKIARSSRR